MPASVPSLAASPEPRTTSLPAPFVASVLAAALLTLGACSSSSDDDPEGTAAPGTPPVSGPGITDPATGEPVDLSGAGLSHAGTPIAAISDAAPTISPTGRARAAALPGDLGAILEVVDNQGPDVGLDCGALGAQFTSCSLANLHIKDAAGALNEPGWRLYFHSVKRVLRADSEFFTAGFINGDLHYLEPKPGFTGLPDGVGSASLVMEFNQLMESDFMPRYWLVTAGGDVVLLPNTDNETDELAYATALTGDNRLAFNGETHTIANSASRHADNAPVAAGVAALPPAEVQARIIPKPTALTTSPGTLDISGGFSFAGSVLPAASQEALAARQSQFMSTANGTPLVTSIDASLAAGTYTLDVTASGISIAGSDERAVFHGGQSLLALVQPGAGTIPLVSVTDSPRFDFRGMHLDVARNFQSPDSVRRLIDQMSAYKLNKLQLHLSDDEGWRLAIDGLPELTDIGGRRAFQLDAEGQVTESAGLMPQLGSGPGSDNQGSGFFSRADYVELLQYASARYVDVIPAFDMPGHTRAAVVAMRARAASLGMAEDTGIRIDDPADTSRYLTIQHYDDGLLNPCIAGTYSFIDTVVNDVKAMHDEAGVALDIWHMGGDEASNIFKGGGFTGNFQGSVDPADYDLPWERSPACATFIAETPGVNALADVTPEFVRRVSQIVADAGIESLYAYQDIFGAGLTAADLATTRSGADFWRVVHQGGYNEATALANRGFDTVIAAPDFLYFDFPQEVDPQERGPYWATRFTDTRKVFGFAPENLPQNAETSVTLAGTDWEAVGEGSSPPFTGMQGQLRTEMVRTPEQVDYQAFPRLLALAERAWHRADWELDYVAGQSYSASSNLVDKTALDADFAAFAAALGTKELAKLDLAGVQYRIPPPGAIASGGLLDMNTRYPGLGLQFSTGADDWQNFDASAPPAGATAVRSVSTDGQRIGRAASVGQ